MIFFFFLKMPHRATYIFPRQFPDRRLDESSKQLLDHEKKKIFESIKSGTYDVESDGPKKPPLSTKKDDVFFSSSKHSAVSELFTGGNKLNLNKHKQIADFCDWLIEKKSGRSGHVKPYSHKFSSEEDRELLLPPESVPAPPPPPPPPETVKDTAIDRSFDREVSLPRLSSIESSYAGSLFSGTTLDGNFSCDIKEETSSVFTTKRKQEEGEGESKERMAQKSRESYYLQLTLAQRLTCLANIAAEPVLTLDTKLETWDAETVSYRLWVRNSLLFSTHVKTTLETK